MGHVHLGGQLPGSRSAVVLYNSLIPGFDHSENQIILYNKMQSSENNSVTNSTQEPPLPRVKKITIFVNEVFKQIDQTFFEKQ